MFNRIKKLRKELKTLETFEPYETDEQGRRVIRLHINDDDYFLSQLSVQGVPCVDDDVAYLLNFYLKNMSIDGDEKLVFKITGNNITEEDKKVYKKAIRNYYREEFLDVQQDLKENAGRTLWFFVLGLVLLGAWYVLDMFGIPKIIPELINICSWVFIWETVDNLFMERPGLRIKQLQNIKILEADIEFENPKQS